VGGAGAHWTCGAARVNSAPLDISDKPNRGGPILASWSDEVREDSEWKIRNKCGVGKLLSTLPPDDLAEVLELFMEETHFVTDAALTRGLERRYKRFSSSSVGRHRRSLKSETGGCQCGPIR